MRVSIIIPTYNSEKTIETCISSVVGQTFRDYELIVVDGVSLDKTIHIAESLLKNTNANYSIISERDKGIYDAMNKGIQRANGEWIYFLGSDDYLLNDKVLDNVFREIEKADHLRLDFVYGNVYAPDYGGRYGGTFDASRLKSQNICHQAIFYRKELFRKLGTYKIEYPLLADYEFNIRCILNRSVEKLYINIDIAFYAPNGQSVNKVDERFLRDKDRLFLSARFKTESWLGKSMLVLNEFKKVIRKSLIKNGS